MIYTMIWPFSIKYFAERINIFHVYFNGETPESKMYGVQLDEIPIKSFRTLFFPVYVLDHRLQSVGGAGPPKW